MNAFWSRMAELWCTLMHPAPMWPSHGYYRCPACLREHRVPWESAQPVMAARPSAGTLRAEARPADAW
jgi:hypothetical protein